MKDPYEDNKLHKLIRSESLKKEYEELGSIVYWQKYGQASNYDRS